MKKKKIKTSVTKRLATTNFFGYCYVKDISNKHRKEKNATGDHEAKSHCNGTRDGGRRSIKIIGKRKSKRRRDTLIETQNVFVSFLPKAFFFSLNLKPFHQQYSTQPSSVITSHFGFKKHTTNVPLTRIIIFLFLSLYLFMFHCSPNLSGRERQIAFISFIRSFSFVCLELFLIVRTAAAS